jgi:hypothetical protein
MIPGRWHAEAPGPPRVIRAFQPQRAGARCAGGGAAGGGGPGDPFAFATGYGALGLEGAYRDRPVLAKPFLREHLVALMAKACGE